MTNSSLVSYVKISPNSTNPRKSKIKKITIHHMAGNLSVETCGNVFAPKSREASSNYGIGSDGRVAMYVEEKNRAWTSSNPNNDNQAITIEVANDEIGGQWHVSDVALAKLIELCVDICKRNDIDGLNYTGNKSGNLTMHKWFKATNCPGPYLGSRFPYIAGEVNRLLKPEPVVESKPVENIDDLVKRTLNGEFGNGADRKNMLAENYKEVQERINEILVGSKVVVPEININDLARRVIRGEFGSGQARKDALGKNYSAVQKRVNEMLN